ncbi:hypothetical protein ACNAW0_14875 [Micromonospora sp. SL1-18]|uniref:hypothetical protein n=1 Tax=Micromonospora sp. SL1-18 TaxID=3399128 RepID=UPI003A4DBBDC
MLPVAFAPPLWAATLRTLRERARVAVTALVLVAGLNGLAAAPATADLDTGTTVLSVSAAAAEVTLAASDAETTAGPVRPALTSPAPGVPPRQVDHDVAPPPAVAVVLPAADPGREPIARRGPPRS